MKNICNKILFACLLFFIACTGSHSPKSVAEKFLKAFEEKKFTEAKKYCTPETVKLIEIAESLSKMPEAKVGYTGKKYKVLSQEINGETAIVKFKETESEEIQTMTVKKTETGWRIFISKEDVMAKQNSEEPDKKKQ